METATLEITVEATTIHESRPFTLADHDTLIERMREGTITAEEVRAEYARFKDSLPSIRAELAKLPLKELRQYRTSSNEKKAQAIESAVYYLHRRFASGLTFTYGLGAGSFERAMAQCLATLTDDQLAEYAAQIKEQRQATVNAITNPTTLDDFDIYFQFRGREAMAIDHRRRYETLRAEQEIEAMDRFLKKRAELRQVDLGDVGFVMKEGWHTKYHHKLWIVQMNGRVEKTTFEDLCTKARALGGNWSSFVKADAGFQFRDQESAERFMALQDGSVSTAEEMEARRELGRVNAAARLEGLAEDRAERASDQLNADRKVNTARRARIAGYVEESARREAAIAQTITAIADALRDGSVRFLKGIRHMSHVEELETILRMAMWTRSRELGERYEQAIGKVPDLDDVDFAEYPYPALTYDMTTGICKRTVNKPGCKLAARRLAGYMQRSYKTAKEKNPHTNELTMLRFTSESIIEDLRTCAGGDGMLGPHSHIGNELKRLTRLRSMGIGSVYTLRAALREYIAFRSATAKPDPVVQLERDLIGSRIDGFFPTPAALVERMIDLAELQEGMKVLEPSAGKGDIVDRIADQCGCDLTMIEISSRLCVILQVKGYEPICGDFLDSEETWSEDGFDRIIMNPPFEDGADADHVLRAFDLLRPGGRIVSIVSEGNFSRQDAKAAGFRQFLEGTDARIIRNEPGSFLSSFRPTGVATRIVVIDKEA